VEGNFMDAATLAKLVAESAALRRRQRLQPVGGKGDKIFPPTYPGEGRNAPPRHVFERRHLDKGEVWCVLVDSVQSQANRLEESLLAAIREGGFHIPHVVVDFKDAGLSGITEITSLEAPHRVYDAILRDSLLDGQPFMKSELGQRLAKAGIGDASALLEVSPTALLFGAWHSTGEGGGLGAKFARSLISEIVAIDVPVELHRSRSPDLSFLVPTKEAFETVEPVTAGRRTGSRIDPLGILRAVEVYKGENGWDVKESNAGKKAKKVRPSEINHGNIAPTLSSLGITCDYLEHMFVLSFAGLRRLRFGSQEKNSAARTLLAALGLLAVTGQDRNGYALRSRCDLVCGGKADFEVVHADGATEAVALDGAGARKLYVEALEEARKAGFAFAKTPIRLTPQDKLIEIVRRSQELALSGEGGEAEPES
jgi:CRISPR-associated protein Csb1